MISRIWSTSWSVNWDTRRASGRPTLCMISLAFFDPIPCEYWRAMTTRLLVRMLTPAMRATVLLLLPAGGCRPIPGPGLQPGRLQERTPSDNATPSPAPRGRASFDFSDWMPGIYGLIYV